MPHYSFLLCCYQVFHVMRVLHRMRETEKHQQEIQEAFSMMFVRTIVREICMARAVGHLLLLHEIIMDIPGRTLAAHIHLLAIATITILLILMARECILAYKLNEGAGEVSYDRL